jgi:hypothetical protein
VVILLLLNASMQSLLLLGCLCCSLLLCLFFVERSVVHLHARVMIRVFGPKKLEHSALITETRALIFFAHGHQSH